MRRPAARQPGPHALRRVCLETGVLLLLLSLAPAAAQASEDETEEPTPPTTIGSGSIGLNGSPRVTRADLPAGTPSASVGAAHYLQPDSARLNDVSYRWWVSRGRADLGIGVGALALTAKPLGARPSAAPNATLADSTILLASSPSVTLGMRFRASPESTVFADASGTRGFGPDNGDAYLGKVGVEWKPASLASRWNIAYGGIGWRLSSDSRMTLRIRGGGIALYMRSQF